MSGDGEDTMYSGGYEQRGAEGFGGGPKRIKNLGSWHDFPKVSRNTRREEKRMGKSSRQRT